MKNIRMGLISLFIVSIAIVALVGLSMSAQPMYYAKNIVPGSESLMKAKAQMPPDLTGVYTAKPGGTFYITQTGNNVYWYGEENSQNPFWSNIAYGTISGNTISLNWFDVPKGQTRNIGTLTLDVTQPSGMIVLTIKQQTGGFGPYQLIRFINTVAVLGQ